MEKIKLGHASILHFSYLSILILYLKDSVENHGSRYGTTYMEFRGFGGELKTLTQIGMVNKFHFHCLFFAKYVTRDITLVIKL